MKTQRHRFTFFNAPFSIVVLLSGWKVLVFWEGGGVLISSGSLISYILYIFSFDY